MAQNATKPLTKDKEATPAWYVAKRVLRAHGITYNEMAERLGTSVTAVHDMCNYTPNVLRVKQMADAIGVPFFEFFDFSQEGDAETQDEKASGEKSSALLSCPHCGTVLTASISVFNKDQQ